MRLGVAVLPVGICVKSFGLRLGRTTGTTIAAALDLTANSHRQNGHT